MIVEVKPGLKCWEWDDACAGRALKLEQAERLLLRCEHHWARFCLLLLQDLVHTRWDSIEAPGDHSAYVDQICKVTWVLAVQAGICVRGCYKSFYKQGAQDQSLL